ncbi:bifunctional helix-turn-helix domain-containing protein/methylated-DNA--[protein]-cysteine S-methyltransferase [Fulvimarina sp. 2208YS6-2-32]|uniref:Bifunctional helix-turn-helix domain-containing protein/methylated-DNA--[protein]-cysteine S-methyltransferase n=1 Tax=Fulvimarina uroteuthidis TaxID=3098149 RepID=A0ABU5I0T2_9HYPH|nr:bifunctional helix-turn-helix domain-containing protein/methylated-DNA--[protein]-cysteine S-methyltransferase [Fulvimarina sp. 2208YS6-2-32]MDY8108988.1 bifunctional helix-turn-helix domain-containing protein/methylated-DNA--[protein]-cysteine S-methyltransferase [Fulvimarina sp. 2208YS6-2-32]
MVQTLEQTRSRPPQEGASGADDYDLVRRAIERLSLDYRDQPSLAELAHRLEVDEAELARTFQRWCGLTPKAFLQAVTLDHARRLLSDGMPLLDAAFEVGLSGPSRLHDLFVKHEAQSPGAYKAKGEGLDLAYAYHPTPFGLAILVATDRGLAGIGFADETPQGRTDALADMRRRWPNAVFREDFGATRGYAMRVFSPEAWRADRPLRIVLIGTDFEVRVWQALTQIPFGRAATYSGIAETIGVPKAARAVGAAVGRNPISFVVPCHRVVGKSGALTGYHWGITRKRAMLGWECGVLARS